MQEEGRTVRVCQSCGMKMAATEHFGTASDGHLSEDYCCFCFQKGDFTHHRSLEETIEHSVAFLDGSEKINGHALTRGEAALRMHVELPTLKRWQSHEVTHREYFKAINRAVDYINQHLDQAVNLSDLAQLVHISSFHFHRIFKALLGESPGEYIQRLRLEKSIFKLQTTHLTLSDIAEQTGYQSPQALSKAFKKRFGISPSEYRHQPSDLPLLPEEPEFLPAHPEIKVIEPQKVMTVRVVNPHRKKDAYIHAWKKLIGFMKQDGIPDPRHHYFSLSHDVPSITESEQCRVYVCMSSDEGIKAQGEFGEQVIGGGLYAVFSYRGPYRNLESLYCSIYRNWLPNSRYELRDTPFFEKYLNSPGQVSSEELLTEVYIPIMNG